MLDANSGSIINKFVKFWTYLRTKNTPILLMIQIGSIAKPYQNYSKKIDVGTYINKQNKYRI